MASHRDVAAALRRDLHTARERQDPVYGMPTSIPVVDRRTGGLHPGELTLLGARPGAGKTALAGQISYDLARHAWAHDMGGQILFFSAEMPAKRILQRELARATGISIYRQMAGEYEYDEEMRLYQTLEQLESLPLLIDDTPKIDPDYIRNQAQALCRADAVLLLIVDHLQIAVPRTGQRQYEAVTATVHALRELRDVVDAPILALSQLRRPESDSATSRPHPTDLRDSGAIEEAANNVWLLHNPPPLGDDTQAESREAELIVAKARDGWTGTIPLSFDPARVSFEDPAPAPVHVDLVEV